MPLLQMFAASIDTPLIIYAENRLFEQRLPEEPQWLMNIAFAPAEYPGCESAVDIDAWLSHVGAYINNQSFSNRQVLKSIGDTIGAHFDRDIHPLVHIMSSIEANYNQIERTFLAEYIFRIGVTTLHLSKSVLSR